MSMSTKPTTSRTHPTAALAGRIARFRERVRNTPRCVLPAHPELLRQHAPAVLAVIFDRAEKHYTAGGHGLLLHRSGMPPIAWLSNGAWHLPGTEIHGGGIVSLTMLVLDIDAADALVRVNVAIAAAAAVGIDLAHGEHEAAA